MFTVETDEAAGVLHLRLWGFWSLDTAHAFAAALVPAMERLRGRQGGYAILSDSSEFPVQSPEVAAMFGRIMAQGGNVRTAIVVASVLNKLQAQRAMPSPRIGVFLTRAEALAWLAVERVPA